MTTISVLLVDDQELVRRGLSMMLDSTDDLVVVGEASTGDEAVHLAERLAPDVVVMDVRMPGMDGIEATRRIVRAHPSSRVLILTTFDLDEYAFGAPCRGKRFLAQNCSPGRTAGSGSSHCRRGCSGVAARDACPPRGSRPEPASERHGRTPGFAELTDREREIFTAVARGLTNPEIAEQLMLSESTVKTHVGRVLAKLDLRDRVQVVIAAYESGLV